MRIIDIKTTGPTLEVISLHDVKNWLVVEHTDDDKLINELIKESREQIERHCSIAIGEQTKILTVEANCEFKLPYGPVDTVTDAEFKSNNSYEPKDANDDYFMDGDLFCPQLAGRWRVTYVTGYGDNIPLGLLNCLKELIAWNYQHRGDEVFLKAGVTQNTGLPDTIKTKLMKYKTTFGI